MEKSGALGEGVPELSVIVIVVDGGAALRRCLNALRNQTGAPSMEVIVPYDDTIAEVGALAGEFPEFQFLSLGALALEHPKSAFDEHELYDKRRSGGLRVAGGRLIAMVEDRGWPRPDWAAAMAALHREHECGVIGGAVESAARGPALWAAYFCDFGRYQPPLSKVNPEYLTDINICYTRVALDSVRPLWQSRYQEAPVNWALRRQGAGARLSDRPRVVQQRAPIGFWAMSKERFHWGRVFGQARGRELSFGKRVLYAAATPILPFVLFVRHAARQIQKGKYLPEFIGAAPAMIWLLCAWSLGELAGYAEAGEPTHAETSAGASASKGAPHA